MYCLTALTYVKQGRYLRVLVIRFCVRLAVRSHATDWATGTLVRCDAVKNQNS